MQSLNLQHDSEKQKDPHNFLHTIHKILSILCKTASVTQGHLYTLGP